jgi:hypothetical protein
MLTTEVILIWVLPGPYRITAKSILAPRRAPGLHEAGVPNGPTSTDRIFAAELSLDMIDMGQYCARRRLATRKWLFTILMQR